MEKKDLIKVENAAIRAAGSRMAKMFHPIIPMGPWEHEGDNGTQLQAYVKVGVGVVSTPNYWGIYYNAGIAGGGWAAYNNALEPGKSNTDN